MEREVAMSDESDSDSVAESSEGFNSKSVALRAQKKVLSRMSTRKVAKTFMDDTTADLMDHLYRIARNHSGNKKEAEKVMKDAVKIVVKIGILFRNEQFNAEELRLANDFVRKFRNLAMTVVSFYEVDFTYDKMFLVRTLAECREMLHRLIRGHLTEKSHGRIDHVFNFFGDGAFLDAVFQRESPHRKQLGLIVKDLHTLMDEEPAQT
ncbi:TNFAIP8L3 [Branchiostoma lanceolatum]|uniref:TNFAIP8L3 protein n=1 Tax=Branchiostoma lanceolatum TaxID=7740 RepID=A0A8J9ZLP3_BRALA|nr:TNFAIP8L3 [Branchiostoma lanceolatum]